MGPRDSENIVAVLSSEHKRTTPRIRCTTNAPRMKILRDINSHTDHTPVLSRLRSAAQCLDSHL